MKRLLITFFLAAAFLQVAKSDKGDDATPEIDLKPLLDMVQKSFAEFSAPMMEVSPVFIPLDTKKDEGKEHQPKVDFFVAPKISESGEKHSSENTMPDAAALEPVLHLIQNSLLNFPIPPPPGGPKTIIPMGPRSADEKVNVQTIDLAPGMKVKVLHRSYSPPTQTIVASGNVNGRHINQVHQQQMFSSQNFAAVQADKNPAKKDQKEDMADDDIPQDFLNEIEAFEKMASELEKLS